MTSQSTGTRQDFLTAREVSARLRLPLSTVYHLAKTGAIQAVHLGRSWRFPAEGLGALSRQKPAAARVLVVDDDEVTRALVTGILESRGHTVLEAGDADTAAVAARAQRFDLLLVDFKLPGKDGAQLIKELRDEYSMGQMIMITAFVDTVDLEKLFGLGAITLLRKPLDPYQLIECVERRLIPPQDLYPTPEKSAVDRRSSLAANSSHLSVHKQAKTIHK